MYILLGFIGFIMQHRADLVGIPLMLLIDWLNKDVHSEYARFFIACFACVAAAVFLKWDALLYGNPTDAIQSWAVIFSESQVVFKLYFKRSSFRWLLQSLYTPDGKMSGQSPAANQATEVIPVTE